MRAAARSRALAEFDALDTMEQVHLGVHQAKRLKPDAYRQLLQAGALDPTVVLRNIERVRRLCELESALGPLMRSFEDAAVAGRRTRLCVVDGGGAA